MSQEFKPAEQWNTQLGAILAVAGSAVGLGNFLRFPGLVALYGGGSFMIAYAVSFLLIGIPLCLAEWTMGRYGGSRGFHSAAGIISCVVRHPIGKYIGVFNIMVPVCLFMYYACIEAWTLGYAVNAFTGDLHFSSIDQTRDFFNTFVGMGENAGAAALSLKTAGVFLLAVIVINMLILWRGLSKGIELFCSYAMPALIVIAIVILVRVLTLGTPNPALPENNVNNGLGFMWNPTKVVLETRATPEAAWRRIPAKDGGELIGEAAIARAQAQAAASPDTVRIGRVTMWGQLSNPQLWLAAAGQVFFTLSVGMGVLSTYASYLRRRDDVVLGSITSASVNEFCEVGLGGLISLPAGVAFLGVASLAGMCSTFELGFNVLPLVFAQLPFGMFFAFLFFFLLFLAAATSSISMLQPGLAFLEEALNVNRKQALAILSTLTVLGTGYCFFFSKNLHAIATLDFWAGNLLVFVCGMTNIIIFAWIFPLERGWRQMHQGARLRLPLFFKYILKYVTPLFLLAVFGYWLLDVFGVFSSGTGQASTYIRELFVHPSPVAWGGVLIMVFFFIFGALIVRASPKLPRAHRVHERRRRARKTQPTTNL